MRKKRRKSICFANLPHHFATLQKKVFNNETDAIQRSKIPMFTRFSIYLPVNHDHAMNNMPIWDVKNFFEKSVGNCGEMCIFAAQTKCRTCDARAAGR